MLNFKKTAWIVLALLAVVAFGVFFFRKPRRIAQTVSGFPEQPNILLITLDTTRADHLSAYGYKGIQTPNIDSLAKKGILFRQCATTSPLTLPAHCSLLTGTYPTYHGVRINGNTALSSDPVTLAEAFEGNGYQTGAFVGAFVLDGRWGLNQGFQHYDDQFDLKKYKKLDLGLVQRPANEVVDAALGWLEGAKEKPFFAWLHLYDPHTPYAPPEPYRSKYSPKGMQGLYDGEIAFMDEQIGRCVKWLDKNNLRGRTIIALIGDHGEGLGDHGELTHGFFIYDYAVRVPFILSAPDWEGLDIDSQVRSIDLYPTLLEAAKIPVPKQVQGTSLWQIARGKNQNLYAYSESMSPSIQYGWSPLLSLRTSRYKYIDAPRPEFFNLVKDPAEQNNVRQKEGEIAGEYDQELKRLVSETSAGAPAPNAANLDSETVERLAALGYVGAPVSAKSRTDSNTLIDPKDRLSIHEAINRAGELTNNDQHADSAAVLEQVLREDPENPQARLLLAGNYVDLKRSTEATSILETLLREDPQNIRALISLANMLQEEGKPLEVIELCKNVLAVDDRNTQALTMMGQAYLEMQNYNDALPWLRKAVEVQPKLTQNQLNLAACLIGLKQHAEAERTLRNILDQSPKFPRAHYHMALMHEERGDLAAAVREYEQEIVNHNDSFIARFNLGRLKLRMGDRAAYMEQMREVVRIAPKNAAGYLFLARGLLQENSDTSEILPLTEQGLSFAKTPEYKAMGYFLLADIYNRQKEPYKMKIALAKANQFKAEIGK